MDVKDLVRRGSFEVDCSRAVLLDSVLKELAQEDDENEEEEGTRKA